MQTNATSSHGNKVPPVELHELHDKLKMLVYGFLDPESLCAASRTCKEWKQSIDNHAFSRKDICDLAVKKALTTKKSDQTPNYERMLGIIHGPLALADRSAKALEKIVEKQLASGNIIGAKETVSQIPCPLSKLEMLKKIAITQAKTDDFKGAIATAQTKGYDWADTTLQQIARIQAEKGDFKGAEDTVSQIETGFIRSDVLQEIAHIRNRKNDLEIEDNPTSETTEHTELHYATYNAFRSLGALQSIAITQSKTGDLGERYL